MKTSTTAQGNGFELQRPPLWWVMTRTHTLHFLLPVFLLAGCRDSEAPGTPENLKADYERLKNVCAEQKQEIERTWRQRVADKDTKIADLTSENAVLRQQLLTVESALREVPLVEAAKQRAALWVHVVYWIIIAACLILLMLLLWFHVTQRERVRSYVMRTARIIPSPGSDHYD